MVKNYPRGRKELIQVFSKFAVSETIAWFTKHGVQLKTEEDQRMFPVSDNSQSIIDCFLQLADKLKISIHTKCEVHSIQQDKEFKIKTSLGAYEADAIICAFGGHHKTAAYQLVKNLGHTIVEPIPSLFTINLPNDYIKKELQGLSVQDAKVSIYKSKLYYTGPVLITHWGLSGPAVLKLSAFAAKEFYDAKYHSTILINWANTKNLESTELELKNLQREKHKSLPYSTPYFNLPKRLWNYLCNKAEITNDKIWAEVSNKQIRQLAQQLFQSSFDMQGKTTFKEEFVTCGGIDLKEVDFKTMQSKIVPGIYFCGEVVNIDGITGGFNFQAAWSTAWVCAHSIQ